MDCSARRPLIALIVASVTLVAGSGCSSPRPKRSRDAASAAREDSGGTSGAHDAGHPKRDAGGMDADTREAGLDAAPDASGSDAGPNVSAAAPDPAFAILGITGPDDDRVDEWLIGTPAPTIHFTQVTQPIPADGYGATIYRADGTTPACNGPSLPPDSTVAEFPACRLTPGAEYRASVVVSVGGNVTSASNDGFAFHPGAIVLGQPDATTREGTFVGLSLPSDVAIVSSHLIVADQNNNRVLIWNSLPTQNQQHADVVLGQRDFSTSQPNYGGLGPGGFNGSNSVASDGTNLIVGDRLNHRVLIWHGLPTGNQPADTVLGQPDLQSNSANNGGVSASSMTEPFVWLGGGELYVADRQNARVLVWSSVPSQNGTPADLVLGQPTMFSNAKNYGGLSAGSLAEPGRGWVDGTRLFVPDLANHRVLVWSTLPIFDDTPADLVLGQPDMTSSAANAGNALSAAGMNSPMAVFAHGNRVAVADSLNHRVLVWTSALSGNGQAADVVLGQPDATSGMLNRGGAVSAASMANPSSVAGDDARLVVADGLNHRLLFFALDALATGASASLALGQPDLASGALNNPAPLSASLLSGPAGIARVGDGLALVDNGHGRVLLWDALPTASDSLPTLVLGRSDFTSTGPATPTTSAQALCAPWDVHSDGTRLGVGEECGRRVAVWNALPSASQQAADLAIGQPDLMSSIDDNGGVLATSLSARPCPHFAGNRLFVADPNNHRVLIWSTLPKSSGAAADLVLGQPDMTSATANNGGIGAQSLSSPRFVLVSGKQLLVVDSGNNRVLIWSAIPSANHAAADVVLGQPNMSSGSAGKPSATGLSSPSSLHVDAQGRLYVVDQGNHRILYWNAIPSENGAAADGVLGQPNLDSGLANNGGLDADRLQSPSALIAVDDRLYVSDGGNDRMLVLPRP